jgi:hypothetical protein
VLGVGKQAAALKGDGMEGNVKEDAFKPGVEHIPVILDTSGKRTRSRIEVAVSVCTEVIAL